MLLNLMDLNIKKICGSFGDISTFSFYANKLITTGEGGMLVMNDKKLYLKALYYRNLCFNTDERFKHYDLGYNFRFTNLQADLGLAQMTKIKDLIKKIQIAKNYINEFKNQNYFTYVQNKSWAYNTYWMFGIVIKNKKISAKRLIEKLKKEKLKQDLFFYGLHKQPALIKKHIINSKCPKYRLYLKIWFVLTNRL